MQDGLTRMPAARPELNADLEIAPPSIGGVPGSGGSGVAEHPRSRSMWSSDSRSDTSGDSDGAVVAGGRRCARG